MIGRNFGSHGGSKHMSQHAKDPIWGTPAVCPVSEDESELRRAHLYDSPRCGGPYGVHETALSQYFPLQEDIKLLLTSWLIEQRRKGVNCPIITPEVVEGMKHRKPMSVNDRADAVLAHIYSEAGDRFGKFIDYGGDPQTDQFLRIERSLEDKRRYNELLAYSESIYDEHLIELKKYLKRNNWIKTLDIGSALLRFSLTPEGCIRAERINRILRNQ